MKHLLLGLIIVGACIGCKPRRDYNSQTTSNNSNSESSNPNWRETLFTIMQRNYSQCFSLFCPRCVACCNTAAPAADHPLEVLDLCKKECRNRPHPPGNNFYDDNCPDPATVQGTCNYGGGCTFDPWGPFNATTVNFGSHREDTKAGCTPEGVRQTLERQCLEAVPEGYSASDYTGVSDINVNFKSYR